MKPFFMDNMYRGNNKQELFFETRFLVCFIENHLLNFTVPSYSINQFDYFLSQSPSFSASNKIKLSPSQTNPSLSQTSLYPSQTSSSLSQIKGISGLYPVIYFLGG
ncbi:hypothetical protein A994_09663 [Methanobacterium formicicum DSM 3637]|uniref:Uncharacterized protein n=2 Tax=Methanobacterium formicicum TaxID=2162 RepID=K2QXV3_METFP|nr:hypothetical protein A994_09663 [Methanobacterium formicicum DSM 3637]